MKENFINSQITKYLKNAEDLNSIFVIKGVCLEHIAENHLSKFIEKETFKNKKINELELFKKTVRAGFKKELVSGFQSPVLISYDTFLYLSNILKDEDLVESKIIILDFSVISYQKCNLQHFVLDIEELSEEGEAFDIQIYNLIIANSVIIEEECYVQYIELDLDLMKRSNIINIISPAIFNFEGLAYLDESDITDTDFLYNYEDRKYLSLVDQGYQNKISTIKILIDNETIQDESSRIEFLKLYSVLVACNITVDIKKIKHNLQKTTRPELLNILSEYWRRPNHEPAFNSLKIYVDPDISKETVEISQGAVVENIIQQYEYGLTSNKTVRDIFLTAPTGAGKSLLFQMPAIYLGKKYHALSIVVSPLKALMVDQVKILKEEKGYNKVAYINSDITIIQREDIFNSVARGDIDILYMAPELLLSYDISYFLNGRRLGLYIVDEAHTVSTWGRDFRIDYWYLGYHINRVRKYAVDANGIRMKFPVVAVTATAPYGNIHDVAFETMSSLQMNAPIKYIGYAKRDDIDFRIDHVEITGNLQTQKINIAFNRIKEFEENGNKTIVYCPFTTQVNALTNQARNGGMNTYPYHGSMEAGKQKESYIAFQEESTITMVATKAFGMGVDIKKITCIYHLAPTGLLTDYIQEIGRIREFGIASVDYSKRDFQFINQLHGLGRMHNWQLKEVMRRLVRLYNETGEQNHLLNAEDFSHVFGGNSLDQIQNDVKKALLLLEKDLNKKFSRIPVIIARPKNMFSTVFASVSEEDYLLFIRKFGRKFVTQIPYNKNAHLNRLIVKLELDGVWEQFFRDKSFGIVKKDFYNERLFKELQIIPKLRISLIIQSDIAHVLREVHNYFEKIEMSLISLQGTFFSKNQFCQNLIKWGISKETAERMSDLILPIFSQQEDYDNLAVNDVRANSNFLQSRRMTGETEYKYRLVDTALGALRTNMRRSLNAIFTIGKKRTELFVSTTSAEKKLYIKIGQLLDVLELGQYEVTGGENPRMFVRINDPFRLRMEAFSNYENQLINDVHNRHIAGVELMKRFFESKIDSSSRWNFIEDFLLGREV